MIVTMRVLWREAASVLARCRLKRNDKLEEANARLRLALSSAMTLDRSFCMYAINSAIIARVSRLGFRLSDSRHAREIVPTSRVDERAEERDSGNATPVSGEQSAIFHGILLRARRATVSLADNQTRKFVIAFTRLSGAFCAISQQREHLGIFLDEPL